MWCFENAGENSQTRKLRKDEASNFKPIGLIGVKQTELGIKRQE